MESIFGRTMYPSLAEWCDIIEDKLERPGDEPIWNVAPPEVDDRPFDAIFLGGGGAGRFGASHMLSSVSEPGLEKTARRWAAGSWRGLASRRRA